MKSPFKTKSPAGTAAGRVYNLQVRHHKKVLIKKKTGLVTVVQQWLEGEDKPSVKLAAYGLLAFTAVYMAAAVLILLFHHT
ncbi:MAG: hypothetical protein H0Z40_09545 [Desulfotomaculum sp.]|nr:hypothetical protein [Desulfotomaculum sp.]